MSETENNNLENTSNNPFSESNENNENEVIETETISKEKYDELNNQYIRLAADFDNFRKRQAQEREALLKYGAEEALKQILPVLDTFERAIKANDSTDDAEKLKESIDVIQKQLYEALEKIGLKKIETVGKEFDPNLHEAVMQTSSNEHPDHSIMAELQSGYTLNDKVLRAALVNVAVNE